MGGGLSKMVGVGRLPPKTYSPICLFLAAIKFPPPPQYLPVSDAHVAPDGHQRED